MRYEVFMRDGGTYNVEADGFFHYGKAIYFTRDIGGGDARDVAMFPMDLFAAVLPVAEIPPGAEEL